MGDLFYYDVMFDDGKNIKVLAHTISNIIYHLNKRSYKVDDIQNIIRLGVDTGWDNYYEDIINCYE